MIERKNQFIKENNQKARLEHLLTAIKHEDRVGGLKGPLPHEMYQMPMDAQAMNINEQRPIQRMPLNLSLRQQPTAEFPR